MKKLILILLFVLISANSFASSSSWKYSPETNPAFRGMMGCFDYLMETRNDRGNKAVAEKRQRMNDALQRGIREPLCREMIVCAYDQEIVRIEEYKETLGQKEYSERMEVLRSLGKQLGIRK